MITLESGNIQNPGGLAVPGGSISLQLNVDATIAASPYGLVFSALAITFQFDATGNLVQPAQIWSNLELNPQNENGLGTYYQVTFFDQNGARINQTPLNWQFTQAEGSTVDISEMTAYLSSASQNIIFYPIVTTLTGDNTFTGTNIFEGPTEITGTFTTDNINNIVTPQMFGCVQDGVTDNNPNSNGPLQQAINYCQAHNGVLWIPPGPCFAYSTGLVIDATLPGPLGLVIQGDYAKGDSASWPGSGLNYTGTGDAILIWGGTAAAYSYFVSIRNLFIGAQNAATSIIHTDNMEGPCIFDQCNFQSNTTSLATNGIFFDNGAGAGSGTAIQVNVTNCYIQGFSGAGIKINSGGAINIIGDQFFNLGVGIYISNSESVTIADSYFELMTYAIEIGNDYEQYGRYDIHGNQFNVGQSQPLALPVNTADQRALFIKSTNNSLPIYMQGSFKHNSVHVAAGFVTGIALYAIEFQVASNTFYANVQWEIEDNLLCGMDQTGGGIGIYSDSADVTVFHRDNVVNSFFTTGSVAPVPLPVTGGSGVYITPVEQTPTGATVTGTIAANLSGNGNISLIPNSGVNLIESGTANAAGAQDLLICGPGEASITAVTMLLGSLILTGPDGTIDISLNNSGTNYFESANAANNAAQNLVVCGPGVSAISNVTVYATTFEVTGVFNCDGAAGVSAGPFTTISSITTAGGIVTALSGTSDERLKDAVDYDGGLMEILAITPILYSWNDKGQKQTGLSGKQKFVGFSAQNVQKAIPQAITALEKSRNSDEVYLSLDDRPIIAALVNAVKTLTARIAELERQK